MEMHEGGIEDRMGTWRGGDVHEWIQCNMNFYYTHDKPKLAGIGLGTHLESNMTCSIFISNFIKPPIKTI